MSGTELPAAVPDVSRRRLVALAWPLALHGLVTVAVSANDVLLLGRVGPTVLASAIVATSLLTVLVMTLTALATATQVEASRASGAGDAGGYRRAVEATLRIAAVVGLPVLVLGAALAPALAGMLAGDTVDPAVAGSYLRIVLLGLPCAVVGAVLRAAATAAGNTRVVLVAGLATATVDVAASLGLRLLVGWPGVAIGTVLGYAAGLAVLARWVRRQEPARRPTLRGVVRRRPEVTRAVLSLGWPEMLLAAFGSASALVVVLVLAGSPPDVLAATRLLDVQVSLAWVLLYAVGQGLLTVLGEAEGARRPDLFGAAVRAAVPVLAVVAVVVLVAGGLAAPAVLRAAGGAEVAAVAGGVLPWWAWAQVLWQAACVLGVTICRASRDTRASLVASLVGEYAVFLPAGLVLCRWLGHGVGGVVLAHHLFWATFVAIVALRARRARRIPSP